VQPGRLRVQPGARHRSARHSLGAHENADIFCFRSQSGGKRKCSQCGRLPVQPGAPHRPAWQRLGAHENADIFYFRSQSGGERACSRAACLCSQGRRTDRRGTVWELMKMPICSISGLSQVGSGSAAVTPACAARAAAQTSAAQSGSSSLVTCAARQLYTSSAVGSTPFSRYY
jgi:hypothetical protein